MNIQITTMQKHEVREKELCDETPDHLIRLCNILKQNEGKEGI